MMKKTKFIYILTVALGIGTLLTSCMKDRANIYTGPTVVEFSPITGTATAKKGTGAVTTATVAVQLVGPQVSTATDINYIVETTSTGVSGTDYSIGGTAGKVTIPANSSSANIVITPLTGFTVAGTKKVIITLTGNSTIAPSANYKTYTCTITQTL